MGTWSSPATFQVEQRLRWVTFLIRQCDTRVPLKALSRKSSNSTLGQHDFAFEAPHLHIVLEQRRTSDARHFETRKGSAGHMHGSAIEACTELRIRHTNATQINAWRFAPRYVDTGDRCRGHNGVVGTLAARRPRYPGTPTLSRFRQREAPVRGIASQRRFPRYRIHAPSARQSQNAFSIDARVTRGADPDPAVAQSCSNADSSVLFEGLMRVGCLESSTGLLAKLLETIRRTTHPFHIQRPEKASTGRKPYRMLWA